MAITIRCPVCTQEVRLLQDGYVAVHVLSSGEKCTFTRTAHSGGAPELGQLSAKALEKKQRKREAEEARRAGASRRAEDKLKAKQQPTKTVIACERCGRVLRVPIKRSSIVPAHQRIPSGRWCRGGEDPTDAQRARAAGRRSIWAVSGGLPTLGRQ